LHSMLGHQHKSRAAISLPFIQTIHEPRKPHASTITANKYTGAISFSRVGSAICLDQFRSVCIHKVCRVINTAVKYTEIWSAEREIYIDGGLHPWGLSMSCHERLLRARGLAQWLHVADEWPDALQSLQRGTALADY
jgi:hypothetical protein